MFVERFSSLSSRLSVFAHNDYRISLCLGSGTYQYVRSFVVGCLLTTTASIVLCLSNTAIADDWPQFLGPNRNGVSNEKGLTALLPEAGPKVVWRTALGPGMSGVAVSDGVVYTLFQDDKKQYLVALAEETGEEKWKSPICAAYENAMGNGPRATPTVTGDTVYAFTGDGVLAAVATDDGKVKWKVDAPNSLSSKPADYGMASSPLVVGKAVVIHAGSTNGNVVAYNIADGERLWVANYGQSGYSSPIVLTLQGTKQIIAFTGTAVSGISIDDGNELWSYDYETEYACNTATPVQLSESTLLISAGENHGSAILKVTKSGDDWSVKETWTSFGNDSVLRAEWQTPVLTQGHLFGLDNKGSAGPITNLVCVNVKDGKHAWSEPRFGKSNLTYADGKLFISTMRGELVIVTASTKEFEETARSVVLGMTRQAPVIANGKLYLRDEKEVVCVDIRSSAYPEMSKAKAAAKPKS